MAFKSVLAAGVLALTMAVGLGAAPAPAEAKTKVIIGIGAGNGCWNRPYRLCGWRPHHHFYLNNHFYQPGYSGYYLYGDDYYAPRRYKKVAYGKFSCSAAKSMLRDRGFNKVAARDCSGTHYSFKARKNGRPYIVKFNAVNGAITGVNRI